MKILDLGCGVAKTEGAYGIDRIVFEGVDLVHDLNQIPYPLENESFDKIIMNDVIEHLDNPVEVMKECYRVLRKDGILIIKVIYWSHRYTWSDMTHKKGFSEISFNFLVGKGRPYGIDFQFKNMDIEYIYDPKAIQKYGNDKTILLEKAYFHSNIIQGMNIELIK